MTQNKHSITAARPAVLALDTPGERMRRAAAVTALAALALAALMAFAAPANAGNAALETLVAEALDENQELAAMRRTAEGLRAEAPFAGSLKDPRLGIGLANVPTDSFELDQEAMTQKQLFISQQVPWFGTLALSEQAALLKAQRQDALVRAKALELTRAVTQAWYDLAFVEQSLAANERLQALVTQALRVAETRYATGKGLQQDILSGQVQLSELLDERAALTGRQRALTERLGALVQSDGPLPQPDPQAAPAAPETLPDSEDLGRRALAANPMLAARRTDVDAASVGVELAQKAYYPDMDFRLTYGQRDEDPKTGLDRSDFLSGAASFSIPLWQATRQDSQLAGAQKKLEAARRSLASVERSLPHQVQGLAAEYAGYAESHDLLQKALTLQAAQWADASLAAYEVGKVPFETMLSARVRLIRYQLRTDRSHYEQLKKLAELEELLGGPLGMVRAGAAAEETIR